MCIAQNIFLHHLAHLVMTQVDFHTHIQDRLHYTCRLIRRAFHAQDNPLHARLIIVAEAGLLAKVDQYLWTFSALDFLPHTTLESTLQRVTPILLASHFDQVPENVRILLNLSAALPPCFMQFQRILEVVDTTPEALTAARERYRTYKEKGYALKNYTHQTT
jgi:DNA polymerase-3 subunit chi